MANPQVTVVILSRDERLAVRLMRSLFRTQGDAGNYRTLIVDDGLNRAPFSQDWGCEFVEGAKPFCFARNANIGIENSPRQSDILLLNDDISFLTPNAITLLSEAATKNSDLGLISSVFTSREVNPRQRMLALECSDEPWRETELPLSFPAIFIKRSTINDIGYLDESLIGYGYEDFDYCLRAWAAGIGIGILPSVLLGHGDHPEMTHSSFRRLPNFCDLFAENRVRFFNKWGATLLGLDEHKCLILNSLLRWAVGIPGKEQNPIAGSAKSAARS